MSVQKVAQAAPPVSLGRAQANQTSRVWVALTGALLVLSAATMLVSLWPYYLQVSTPCDDTGFCFPPALFADDVAVLAQYGISLTAYATLIFLLQSAANLGYLSLAGVLFWRRRSSPMVLCTVALLATQPLAPSGYLTAIIDLDGPGLAVLFAAALVTKVVIILFLALFPTGSLVPRGLRRYLPWLLIIVTAAVIAEGLNPLHRSVRLVVYSVETFWILTMLLVQLYRYRYVSSPDERRQTRWLMALLAIYFGYTIGFVWFIGTTAVSADGWLTLLRATLFMLLYLLQLAVIFGAVMALRQGLYNLSRLMAPAVVYALLTVCVVAIYVLLVGGISMLLRPDDNTFVALLATGVVAMAFHPLRAGLQRGVNQLIYGRRDNPRQVLTSLAQQLERAVAADVVMSTIVETLARELKLPYAAIVLDDEEDGMAAASVGAPAEPLLTLPLLDANAVIGRLFVAARAPEEPFTPDERRLLDDLARQAGVAVRAARLNHELQRSRERLVDAREEERRRLQRDLHDGLGPTLASMSMQLDAARVQLADDPAASEALLAEVQAELKETVGTVRRLVHQLRPPLLDQLGLAGAISEHVLRVERGSGMRVALDLPAALPPFSAAVEVAAYYIVVEALNNVTRHAHARSCSVRLHVDSQLRIEVQDNGGGLPTQVAAGVGLRSMRERAQELGGTCQVGGGAGGGTIVRAALPLKRASG